MQIEYPIHRKIISLKKIEKESLPDEIKEKKYNYDNLFLSIENNLKKDTSKNKLFDKIDLEDMVEQLYDLDAVLCDMIKANIKKPSSPVVEESLPKEADKTKNKYNCGFLNRING